MASRGDEGAGGVGGVALGRDRRVEAVGDGALDGDGANVGCVDEGRLALAQGGGDEDGDVGARDLGDLAHLSRVLDPRGDRAKGGLDGS